MKMNNIYAFRFNVDGKGFYGYSYGNALIENSNGIYTYPIDCSFDFHSVNQLIGLKTLGGVVTQDNLEVMLIEIEQRNVINNRDKGYAILASKAKVVSTKKVKGYITMTKYNDMNPNDMNVFLNFMLTKSENSHNKENNIKIH